MEGFIEFWQQQGFWGFVAIFWFYFLFDFPRSILTDYMTMLIFFLQKNFNKGSYDEARDNLWEEKPLVSVVIPGKDEGENYYKLVSSLQEQTYQHFETIVVDDGSSDYTKYIGRDLERSGKIDRFLRNEVRGGKASAANLGLRYAKGKYILHFDADCSFYRNAIEEALIPFYRYKNVGAVGCSLEVRNTEESLATRFQTIEYLNSITVGRMTSSSLGILQLVSGAFGAFRKEVLKEIGGWDVGPGEDGDISQKIKKLGKWKIIFTPSAVALTDVPASFTKLTKQRLRWSRSLVRNRIRKHRNVFYPGKHFYWRSMMASLTNIYYSIILNFSWWFYLILLTLNYIDNLQYVAISIYVVYVLSKFIEFGVVPFITYYKYDKIKLLPYLPGMVLYTGYYMRFVRTYAYLTELFGYLSFKDSFNPRKSSNEAKKVNQEINTFFQK